MPCLATAVSTADLRSLLSALGNYSQNYDEAFDEVRARIVANGYATKLDIGGLACWKRIRCDTPWVRELQQLPQTTVTNATAVAFAAGLTPMQRVSRLRTGLRHGMGGDFALGSALLTAWNPSNFGITDRRARNGLRKLMQPYGCTCRFKGYSNYPEYVGHLIAIRTQLAAAYPAQAFTARMVDQALFGF